MSSTLRQLLNEYRATARTEREKGTYFERLAVAFMKNDPGMQQEYEDAWLYADWAEANGVDGRDDGIDVVARIRDDGGFCAIQCKFYRTGHRIQKSDIETDKASGIVNDANRYAVETIGDPAYPLLLLQRVITVSIETMKIVRGLPALAEFATTMSPLSEAAE